MENSRFKFRAWHKASKKMYNVKRIGFNDVDFKTSTICVDITNNGIRGALLKSANEYILMQCTGLKDKNGKLIYEGDIVKVEDEDIAQIKWKQDSLMFYISYIQGDYFSDFFTYNSGDLQVIGNIYENPELLEDNNE